MDLPSLKYLSSASAVGGQKRLRNDTDDVEASTKHRKLDLASGSATFPRPAQDIDSLVQLLYSIDDETSITAKRSSYKTHISPTSPSSSLYCDHIYENDSDIESSALLNAECDDWSGYDVEGSISASEISGDHCHDVDSIVVMIENLEALELPLNRIETKFSEKRGIVQVGPVGILEMDIPSRVLVPVTGAEDGLGTDGDLASGSSPMPLSSGCQKEFGRSISTGIVENQQNIAASTDGEEGKLVTSSLDSSAPWFWV